MKEENENNKVICDNCNSEITFNREELVEDENNLALMKCPECGENITIDLGIPEED